MNTHDVTPSSGTLLLFLPVSVMLILIISSIESNLYDRALKNTDARSYGLRVPREKSRHNAVEISNVP